MRSRRIVADRGPRRGQAGNFATGARGNVGRRAVSIALIAVVLAVCGGARADMLRLGTGLNVSVFPGGSSAFVTVPLFNDTGTPTLNHLAGWQVSLRIVPQLGSTGTVSIDTATIGYPANNVLHDPFPAAAPQLTISGGDVTVTSTNADFTGDTVPNSGKALFVVRVNASPTALGLFDLVVFNDAAGNRTNWTDSAFTNQAFTNAPFVSGNVLTLGTITAVPEPGSLLICVAGCLATGAYGRAWRRRRGRALPVSEWKPIG